MRKSWLVTNMQAILTILLTVGFFVLFYATEHTKVKDFDKNTLYLLSGYFAASFQQAVNFWFSTVTDKKNIGHPFPEKKPEEQSK